jgi:hypothetical protein
MQTCPYCAEEIESVAEICPYCRMNLRQTRVPRAKSSNATMWIVIGAVLGGGVIIVAVLIALMLPAVQASRDAARRSVSRNNLKQIGLALHNYHDTFRVFPPGGVFDADGAGHHSWQSMLLPFIDQAPLYSQIDFDVPWDDPRNSRHFQYELPVYLNPSLTERHSIEGYGLSHYAGNSRLLNENTGMSLREITDGTANTILAGEVSNNLKPWGFPANYRDPARGNDGGPEAFGRPNVGGQFLMGDGSVRFINQNVHPDVLKALSTPDGGEPVGEF